MRKKQKTNKKSKKQNMGIDQALETHKHPDHSIHIKRLKKAKGQLEGIEKMILDKRYCTDIIVQLKAASAALKAIEAEVLKSHLKGCVKSAFNSNDVFKSEEKIQEIIKLIY